MLKQLREVLLLGVFAGVRRPRMIINDGGILKADVMSLLIQARQTENPRNAN